jgi:hypothetical protein
MAIQSHPLELQAINLLLIALDIDFPILILHFSKVRVKVTTSARFVISTGLYLLRVVIHHGLWKTTDKARLSTYKIRTPQVAGGGGVACD